MSVPLDAIALVSFVGECFGQRIMLTMHYIKKGGPSIIDPQTEMSGLIDELIVGGSLDILTDYLECLPPEYSTLWFQGQVIDPVRYAYYRRAVSTPGTHASSATVANDAAAITLRTENAGRRYLGTKKIGPVPDAASAAGVLTAPFQAKLATVAGKMLNPVTTGSGADYRPIIFSKGPPVRATPLTTYIVGKTSRVNRRRTVGLGE